MLRCLAVTYFSPNYCGLVNPSVALVCDFGFDLHNKRTRMLCTVRHHESPLDLATQSLMRDSRRIER